MLLHASKASHTTLIVLDPFAQLHGHVLREASATDVLDSGSSCLLGRSGDLSTRGLDCVIESEELLQYRISHDSRFLSFASHAGV